MFLVGSFVVGMVYEINNLFGVILYNVQNIKWCLFLELVKNVELVVEVGVLLEDINYYFDGCDILCLLEGIQYVGLWVVKIVIYMFVFSCCSYWQMIVCELFVLFEQVVEIVGNDFDLVEGFDFKLLQIVYEFDFNFGLVLVIVNEVEQVLFNLLKNVVQVIYQCDDEEEGEQGWIVLCMCLMLFWVEVQVEDNGSGMFELVCKCIFELFFIIKEVGQGIGFGLFVLYFIIINNYKGQMEVCLELGCGICFSICLLLESFEVVVLV